MAPKQILARGALAAETLSYSHEESSASTSTASATNVTQIIGVAVGAGVGGIIVLSIIGILIRLHLRRRRHREAIAELETSGVLPPVSQMEQTARPLSAVRCGSLMSMHAGAGWDALGSNDTINKPEQSTRSGKRKRSTVSLPKRMKSATGIPLKKISKHLSAIAESPNHSDRKLSRPSIYESTERVEELMGPPTPPREVGTAHSTSHAIVLRHDADVFTAPGSPKSDVLPSFAIKSPGRHGAAIANGNDKNGGAIRSLSLGVLRVDTSGAVFGDTDRLSRQIAQMKRPRPAMHARSVSLGAPTSRPPSGPVPPLPVISPHTIGGAETIRQGVCVSRMSSSSSMNSAGSSVLVISPILQRNGSDEPLSSPTVEQLVAENDDAALKTVTNARPEGPTRFHTGTNMELKPDQVRKSVNVSVIRSSTDSALLNRFSSSSISSTSTSDRNRLSIPIIATADRVSLSRVSSSNSLTGTGGVQKITTPKRKQPRRLSSVSANGSPAEKSRKNAILRDISGNAQHCNIRQRNMSISTQASSRSSNGNPFHWDCSSGASNVLPKPSAMKGSPNARKGHRRQNCVRISTLSPQVLGPASNSRSRSQSPAPGIVMDEILEERESDDIKREVQHERREVERAVASERRRSAMPRPPLPPRNTSSESCLRIHTLRASLTPSSPTLSAWNAYNEAHGGILTSQPSDSALTATSSPFRRPDSTTSEFSHTGSFTIPRFPSPVRASVALTRPQPEIDTAPMPDFGFDLESPTLGIEDKNSSSPFALAMSSDEASPVARLQEEDSPVEVSPVSPVDLPSSPPFQTSRAKEYNPAQPSAVHTTSLHEGSEYDPASPPMIWEDETDMQRSSMFLPFANLDHFSSDALSPKSRPNSYALPESPPLSPKSVPDGFQAFSDCNEKLTSENASSIMARFPQSTSASSFLGTSVPILLPPKHGEAPSDMYIPRQEQLSQTLSPVERQPSPPRHPFVAIAPSLPTIPQSDDLEMPSPLNIRNRDSSPGRPSTSPQGPRRAPGQSVLRNAMALRRMNSELSHELQNNRETRTYARLGREASPLLPWTSGDANDGVFDFDFDAQGGARKDSGSTTSSPPSQRRHQRYTSHGVPIVDSPKYTSALTDTFSMPGYERTISPGFEATPPPPPKSQLRYTGDGRPAREHISPRSRKFQEEKRKAQRESFVHQRQRASVWDDGEKFWTSPKMNDEKHESVDSLQLPQFGQATPPREEERTIDPKLLTTSSPTLNRLRSSGVTSVKSLYDGDGFLKA